MARNLMPPMEAVTPAYHFVGAVLILIATMCQRLKWVNVMATAHDVAVYILAKEGRMTAMKLQKLVYYSQAWHLAWADESLFGEEIQAWANGPVVYELYLEHRGKYWVTACDLPQGNASGLNADQAATVDSVLEAYGDMTGAQLSKLTHAEAPWQDARGGLPDGGPSSAPIIPSELKEYYGSLDENTETVLDPTEINFPSWLDAPV